MKSKSKRTGGFFPRVYEAVRLIPHGKVTTYGAIAAYLGSPKSSRAVGYALHVNPYPVEVPCHRVVNRHGSLSGSFAFGGGDAQRALLESEGVSVSDDYTVNLSEYGYFFG